MRCVLQRTYLKNLSFFFFTPRDPRGICNPGTSPIGIEFFREVLRAMPTISLVPTIPSIPLRRKFFSNCATLISSCALRRVPHFIQPPFLPSSSIPSRRFVAARGTDTRGIYTLYENREENSVDANGHSWKEKRIRDRTFFFSEDKYKLFRDIFLNSTYINLY